VQHGESSKHRGAARPTSLALVEAFRDLPPAQLADLEQRLVTVPVPRGEILMCQGDPADALYLVATGRFVVEVNGRRIAEGGSGSPLGGGRLFRRRDPHGYRHGASRCHRPQAAAGGLRGLRRPASRNAEADRRNACPPPRRYARERRPAAHVVPPDHCRDRCRAIGRAGSISSGASPRAVAVRTGVSRRFPDACRGVAKRDQPRLRRGHELVQQAGASLPLRALFRRRGAHAVQPQDHPSGGPGADCRGFRVRAAAERVGALCLRHPPRGSPAARAVA
jgi:hypothetical protein